MTAPVALAPPLSLPRMILHLCRFDLRRFRVLIAVLVGVEVLRGIYVEWSLHLAPLESPLSFRVDVGEAGTTLLDPFLALGFIVATAIIVQADHPSDDRAFWRSRPIPGHALALAKLALFAVLFVVVPAAINTVRLLAYGAPAASVFAAIVQLGWSASAIIPIWALAILTPYAAPLPSGRRRADDRPGRRDEPHRQPFRRRSRHDRLRRRVGG